jgi:TolA-binding protein
MRSAQRHQLKHDRFAEATKETVSWAVEHRKTLITAIVVAALALVLVLGGWGWLERQNRLASVQVGKAIRTYQTEIRPAGAAPQPNVPSFASAEERAKAAQAEFSAIAEKYGFTKNGRLASYFVGLTALELGDYAAAERRLKDVAERGDQDLQALAKFALASVYRSTGRQKEAIDIYRQLSEKPTPSVSKTTVQLELAALFEAIQQPDEARRIYEQIGKDAPAGIAAQIAQSRLQTLK